jgi:CRISPR-associated protein Csx10
MAEQNQQANDTNSKLSLPESFNVRLRMKSDWHVGSGVGRPGNVDRLIARDAGDFPFIPAKTLTGIWRDAAETLAYALDEGKGKGRWAEWIDVVFGDQPALASKDEIRAEKPRPAALSVSPASLSEVLRQLIRDQKDRRLLSALTYVKPGVAIDERSGTASTDFLRFEEMARMSTELVARCELNTEGWNPIQKVAAAAMLLASTRLVERLGGKRRRGAGQCEMLIEGFDVQGAFDWLEKDENKQPPDLPPAKESKNGEGMSSANAGHPDTADEAASSKESSADAPIQSDGANEWMRLSIRLKLKTPITIASRTLGNVSETLDFVPGTYLLPHITKSLKKLGYDCRDAVASGDIQVLPVTIEINKARGLPVPKVLVQRKVGGGFDVKGTVVNRLRETMSEQTKNLRAGYIAGGNEKLPIYRTVPQTLLTHNTVKDDVQRPTEAVGGVYSREAIAPYDPHTKSVVALRTELRLRKPIADALKGDWWTKLNGSCRLGVSRKDDYGAAELEVLGQPQQIIGQPSSDPQKSDNGKELLTVWFLSDVLLRDEGLRQTSLIEALQRELQKRLREFGNSDIKLKEVEWEKPDPIPAGQNADDKSRWVTSLLDTRRIESWHEGWGLPRPSLVAIKAGSCIVFEVESGAVDLNTLARIEHEGIGERRGEGYGQLCFNHPLLISKIKVWEPSSLPDGDSSAYEGQQSSAQLTEGERKCAEIVEEAAWRDALRRAALKATDTKEKRKNILGLNFDERKNSVPPMSQLGGLRSVVERLSNDNAKLVTDWLDHLNETSNRREKWVGALEKVCKLFGDRKKDTQQKEATWTIKKERIWEAMKDDWQDPPTLVRQPKELRERLWAEAVRTLVDAGIRAHKRELERMQSGK